MTAGPSILETIAAATRARVAAQKAALPLDDLRAQAKACPRPDDFPFERALRADGLSFIGEVKKASPSKGVIAADFPYLDIARDYEQAGVAAISVLTEPDFFAGHDEYLAQIAAASALPCLRKDFVVDEYQLYQARALGAAAVLLIVALLDDNELRHYLALAEELGLSALVEAHDESEARAALAAGARLLGVNNRDLHTFQVDVATTERIAPLVPLGVVLVAESGVADAATVARLQQAGVDAILIGEALMRAPDKFAKMAELRAGLPKIKICGLTSLADIDAVNQARPDYAGFVFAPSRRQVTPEQASRLRAALAPGITPVGVFVDEPGIGLIWRLAHDGIIALAQLHGHEDEAFVAQVRERAQTPVIKAVRLADSANPLVASSFDYPAADYLLLDSTAGSGRPFDWGDIPPLAKPFFLAGGIGLDNIEAALAVPGVFAVDVSSGAERAGHKDPALIAELVHRTRIFGNSRIGKEL